MKILCTTLFLLTIFAIEPAMAMEKIKLPVVSSYYQNPKPERKIASSNSSITVYKVEESKFELAEKWVDSSTGVVCYSVSNLNKKSISCVKLK
ncbi:MAG: hypothetical protein ACOYL6_18575 [Bacteriovoracaceae bacterium]